MRPFHPDFVFCYLVKRYDFHKKSYKIKDLRNAPLIIKYHNRLTANQEINNKFHKPIDMSFRGYAGIESPPAKQTFDAEHTISDYSKYTVIWTQKSI